MNLNEGYDLTPKKTLEPWTVLKQMVFTDPDERTLALTDQLKQFFFESNFQHGTMILVEGFDVQDYEKYFSVSSVDKSYLYNYIRYNTAHGDVRRIAFDGSGFTNVDVNAVKSNLKSKEATLQLLMDQGNTSWALVSVPPGYPYLKVTAEDEKLASPNEVSRIRDGRFWRGTRPSSTTAGRSSLLSSPSMRNGGLWTNTANLVGKKAVDAAFPCQAKGEPFCPLTELRFALTITCLMQMH